jgi:hypothetical protein
MIKTDEKLPVRNVLKGKEHQNFFVLSDWQLFCNGNKGYNGEELQLK